MVPGVQANGNCDHLAVPFMIRALSAVALETAHDVCVVSSDGVVAIMRVESVVIHVGVFQLFMNVLVKRRTQEPHWVLFH